MKSLNALKRTKCAGACSCRHWNKKESLDEQSAAQQFSAVNKFMKKIFPGMSDGDLENADGDDVMNTFKQLLRKAGKIAGSNNSKNSTGAE